MHGYGWWWCTFYHQWKGLLWLLRSVFWVSLFAPGLWSAIWVSFFHSRSVVRDTFQSLVMSVFWVKKVFFWSACVYNRSESFPGFIFSLAPRLTVNTCAVNAYWSSHCRANTQHCRKRRQGFVQGKFTVCRGMDGVPRLSAEQGTSGTMPFVSRERWCTGTGDDDALSIISEKGYCGF